MAKKGVTPPQLRAFAKKGSAKKPTSGGSPGGKKKAMPAALAKRLGKY